MLPEPSMASYCELHAAIWRQDIEAIEMLLNKGDDVNDAGPDGITALHIASMNDSSNIVRIIISHGAFIDPQTHYTTDCHTPLHIAVERGHIAIVKVLLSNNADVNVRTKGGMSALDIAVQTKSANIVRELLRYGASVNSKSSPTTSLSNIIWRNCHPLHRAVESGQEEIVKLLIENGADVNADAISINDNGIRYSWESEWTPLHIAAEHGYVDIVRMLLENGANVNSGRYGALVKLISPLCIAMKEACRASELLAYLEDPDTANQPRRDSNHEIITNMLLEYGAVFLPELDIFQAGLHEAVRIGNTKTVGCILKSFPGGINTFRNFSEANCTLLHTAASVWNVKSVHFLLHRGANVNGIDRYDHTPIFYAVTEKDELTTASRKHGDKKKTVQLLLCHGHNVDCIDENLQTPLHHAVKHGNYERVNFLLMNDACVESHVDGIISPLHLAVMYEHVEIIKVLLDNGARINSMGSEACTSSSNSPKRRTGNESPRYRPLCLTDVMSYPLDCVTLVFDSLPVESWTALHCAVRKGHEELVKLLLSKADGNCTSTSTPLYSAIASGHHRIVKLLVDHGFYINIEDREMKKAMFTAVRCGYLKTIEHVFKRRPDTNGIVDDKGCTLLHRAVVHENSDVIDGVKEEAVVELLIKHGCNLNALDEHGGTPLMLAIECVTYDDGVPNNNMVKCLLEHGAYVNPKDEELQTVIRGLLEDKACPILELLFQHCHNVELLMNANGNPFLNDMIEEDDMDVAMFLIKHGANVNAMNKSGKRALHLADNKPQFVKLLLESGADVNGRDKHCKTALHWVASDSCEKSMTVMTILLKYGADVNLKCDKGLTALDYTSKKPNNGTRIILLKHLIKMKAANLFLSRRNLRSIDLSINDKDSFVDYKDWYKTCNAECENMRKTKIADTSICFHDVLTKISYAKNESVVKVLESRNYEKKFPLYSDFIDNYFERARKRVNLLNQIPIGSYSLLGYKLPADLSMKIFGCLSNRDLRNLIAAYTNDTC